MKFKTTIGVFILTLSGLSLSGAEAAIEEHVVVTATKDKVESSRLSKKVQVVTKKDIQKKGGNTAADILKTVPGVIINQNGNTGSPVSVYLRGSKPGQTMIMVDGIEVNDPMTPDMGVDLSSITAAGIERIEIVYGSAATVYGSNAMGGVINIITTKDKKGGSLLIEGGSLSTKSYAYDYTGGSASFTWWIKGSHFKTDGISAASEEYGNTEEDGFKNISFNSGFSYKKDNHTFSMAGTWLNSEGDLDTSGGRFGDDDDYTFDRKDTYLKGEWTILNPFMWDGSSKITFTKADNKREYLNPGVLQSAYNGTITRITLHNTFQISRSSTLSFGLETKNEEGDSVYISESQWGSYEDIFNNTDVSTDSAYLLDRTVFDNGLIIELGARYDNHDYFGSELSTSAGLVKWADSIKTRFWMNGGTSFKAPTLYQLFSPYGDTELSPEEGKSFEVGFETRFMSDNGMFSFSYYSNDFDNMIDFNSETYTYSNIASAEIKGYEAGLQFSQNRFAWGLFYNRYKTRDKTSGEKWLRRPDHSMTAFLDYAFNRWSLHIDGIYNSKREDLNFSAWPSEKVFLESFTVFNVKLDYKLSETTTLYVKGHNVSDETYEMVYGYGTLGSTWYGGLVYRY